MIQLATIASIEVNAIYAKANAFLAKGCLDFAEFFYLKLVTLESQGKERVEPAILADTLHNLGMIAQERKCWTLALSYYLEALETNPDRVMTWLFLAQLYLQRFEAENQQSDYDSGKNALLQAATYPGNYPIIGILKEKFAIN